MVMLTRHFLVTRICKRAAIERKRPSGDTLSRQELLQLNSYLDIFPGDFFCRDCKSKVLIKEVTCSTCNRRKQGK